MRDHTGHFEPVALVCNDKGKLLGLQPNRVLRDEETGKVYDILCGIFFLCSAPPDSEHFESLSGEQIERYKRRFQQIEFFLGGAL